MLQHIEQIATFAVEGHLYRDAAGREFYVFTAGTGEVWSAAPVQADGRYGDFVVRAAADRPACVAELRRVLAAD